MNVSDCLSVLRKSVSWGEDLLRDVLLVVIHMLVIVFLVDVFLPPISYHGVVVVKPLARSFRKVNFSLGICGIDSRFASV